MIFNIQMNKLDHFLQFQIQIDLLFRFRWNNSYVIKRYLFIILRFQNLLLNLEVLWLWSPYLFKSTLFLCLVDALRIDMVFFNALALRSLILFIDLILTLIVFCFLQLPFSVDCIKIYLLLHEDSCLKILKNCALLL